VSAILRICKAAPLEILLGPIILAFEVGQRRMMVHPSFAAELGISRFHTNSSHVEVFAAEGA
jgi:hypothetical protein